MAFEVETRGETQATVRIRVAREELDHALAHELGHVRERARVPGFRPGKVPKQLLRKRLGDSLVKDVRRRLIERAFEEGIVENKLHPVDGPRVEDADLEPKEDGSLAVEFELEVIPHFEITGFDRFTSRAPPIRLTDEDVDREIEGLRRQAARSEEVPDGLVAPGDVVVADLKLQFLDGTTLPPFENRLIDTGAGLVDGVECPDARTKFVAARRGAVVQVSMKLPEQFPVEEHRGKTAVTDCTVKDVRRISLPEATATEFLAAFGATDLDDLRAKVRVRLQQYLEAEQGRALEEMCVDELIERNRFVLPPAFLQRNLDGERERIRRELAERGIPPEQVERHILENEGRLRGDIERRLRATILLDRLADHFEVQVSSKELEQQFERMGRAWNLEPGKLYDELQAQGLVPRVVGDVRRAKTRRRLRETAAAADNEADTDDSKSLAENAP